MDFGASALVSIAKAILDYISGRVRIDAGYHSGLDDEIHIYNESDKAVAIRYWRLVWRKTVRRFPPKYEYEEQDTGIEGWEDHFIKIGGKDKHILSFEAPYDFNWNPPAREGQKLYLELYVGKSRRPLRFHIHEVYIHKPNQINN
ncbi:hypothetical protein [Dyadobacter sp. CY356]|uniref:hypothetical protein n=1 Tax=Dyadobacter sp. CY356 TaxID=2906442 RepID=UPI001F270C73|nr:hypothetical protein [Dyadobacter sp. CY356]MCF0055501.1 hypothetical protein [Dyadobacter sp. CY356]